MHRKLLWTSLKLRKKKCIQLMRLSFEAASSGRSTDITAERPLCLSRIAVGFLLVTRDELIHVDRLCQVQPKFANLVISWGLRHNSDDKVRTAASESLLPCRCDASDRTIALLHSQDAVPGSVPEAITYVGSMVFNVLSQLLCHAHVQRLMKLNELEQVEKRHKRFEELSRYVANDPRSMVRACCDRYRVCYCKSAILALSRYIPQIPTPSALEYSLLTMGSKFIVLLLWRIDEIVHEPQVHRTGASSHDTEQEIVHISIILLCAALPGMATETCISTLLGPQVRTIYDLLLDILPWAQFARLTDPEWNSRQEYLRAAVLPSLHTIIEDIRRRFGDSLNLGPSSFAALEFAPPLSEDLDLKYTGVLYAMCRLRALKYCGNLACRESFYD